MTKGTKNIDPHQWQREFNWLRLNLSRVISSSINIEESFPTLVSLSSKQDIINVAKQWKKEQNGNYHLRRERRNKPKMYPLNPRPQEYASPETLYLLKEQRELNDKNR